MSNIKNIFKSNTIPNAADIRQYTTDLKSMTLLRNSATEPDEILRYTHIIEIMQKTLIRVIDKAE